MFYIDLYNISIFLFSKNFEKKKNIFAINYK